MVTVFSLEGKRPALHYISIGMVLVGVSFLILNLPSIHFALIAFVAMIFITFGEIFAAPFMNAWWISRANHNNRGQYAALYAVAWSSAQAIGPFAGSLVAEYSSFKILWFVLGGVCFLLSFFYRKLYHPPVLSV